MTSAENYCSVPPRHISDKKNMSWEGYGAQMLAHGKRSRTEKSSPPNNNIAIALAALLKEARNNSGDNGTAQVQPAIGEPLLEEPGDIVDIPPVEPDPEPDYIRLAGRWQFEDHGRPKILRNVHHTQYNPHKHYRNHHRK